MVRPAWAVACLVMYAGAISGLASGCAAAKSSIDDFNRMDVGGGPRASMIQLTELQKSGVAKRGEIDSNRANDSSASVSKANPDSPASSGSVRTVPIVSASTRTVPQVPVPLTETVIPDPPTAPVTQPASSVRMQPSSSAGPAPVGNMTDLNPTDTSVSTGIPNTAFAPNDNPAAAPPSPPTHVTPTGPQFQATGLSSHTRDDYSGGPRYRLGPEDKIRVSVWENKELTLDVVVRPDGKISVPLIQDVQAEGLTASELGEVIRLKLQDYLKDPHVSVIVLEVNASKFYVVGYVKTPGTYPLRGDVTVLQALSLAGGFTEFASPRKIRLVRKSGQEQEVRVINYYDLIDGGGEGNDLLRPGDTIVVP